MNIKMIIIVLAQAMNDYVKDKDSPLYGDPLWAENLKTAKMLNEFFIRAWEDIMREEDE
jgi:hypothetical protein